MLTVAYDEDNKRIIVERSKQEHNWIYLMGGGQDRRGRGIFPMSAENIQKLLKSYPADGSRIVWKPSLVEGMVNFIRKEIKSNVAKKLLAQINMGTIDKFPELVPLVNGNPAPFRNQKISQHWARHTEAHAMLWEMGTGKTRGSIDWYRVKVKQGEIKHVLVVCPLSMVWKWVDEVEKWSETKAAIGLDGTREEKLKRLSEDWDFYVVTYETLALLIEHFEEKIDENWLIVLDEFTKIKNPAAKRAKACLKLGKLTPHKLILSGTPITQHGYDIFTPYLFLDGGKTFGLKYDEFIDKYYWRQGYKKVAKAGSLQEISDKIYHTATRFVKKDCIDIPDKLYDHRMLDLPPYNREKYNEMVQWAITKIEGSAMVTASVILTQLLRLSQITSGFVVDAMGHEVPFEENPKIDALRDIFEETNGAKTVIWCRFIHDVKAVSKLCKDMNIGYVTLFGEDKQDARYNNIKAFQNDSNIKCIIGTAGTGGHGIDLTAASLVVYYSNSYSLEQRLQSEDRAHRAGQRNQVTYIDLLCKNTIDAAIYKILRNKKSVADIVTKDNLRNLL